MTCEHHYCRCARARELLDIYDHTGDGRYLRMAIDIHHQPVTCRLAAAGGLGAAIASEGDSHERLDS